MPRTATGALCSCRFASTCGLQARKEHIISLQPAVVREPLIIQSGNKQQERASDALSAAALRFEATPPPPGLRWSGRASDSALHLGWRKYLPSSATDCTLKLVGYQTRLIVPVKLAKVDFAPCTSQRQQQCWGNRQLRRFIDYSRSNRSFRHPAI
jgi:hypothetical protein